MFVFSTTLLCIYVFAFCWVLILKLQHERHMSLLEAMSHTIASIVLIVYTFIAVWFVGGLTLFHLYLISTNQTTYENFRYRYDSKVNPYNQGVVYNFKEIFCGNISPSKNDFRAKVQQGSARHAFSSPTVGGNITSPNMSKGEVDLEMGGKPAWPTVGIEASEDMQGRNSNGEDIGLESKDGYADTFAHALGYTLPLEGIETRSGAHPRRSSWGRKSGSWEITSDILALAAGVGGEGSRVNGDSTPPGNR